MRSLPELNTATLEDERLRQYACDAALFEQAIALAQAQLTEARFVGDQVAVCRLLGYLGDALRSLNRLDEAVAVLSDALALAEQLGQDRLRISNLIRLGEARKYREEHEVAETLFRQALASAWSSGIASHQGFALQHLGKCLIERGRTSEAIDTLEAALSIRQVEGEELLTVSTERALSLARAKLGR